MKRALKHIKIIFAAYFALHLLCNAAFLHKHTIDGQSISHSHIFKGVQHTAANAELIQSFNNTSSITTDAFYIPDCTIIQLAEIHHLEEIDAAGRHIEASLLRGPPVQLI